MLTVCINDIHTYTLCVCKKYSLQNYLKIKYILCTDNVLLITNKYIYVEYCTVPKGLNMLKDSILYKLNLLR